MSDYKTVMLAVDLTEESLQVAKRATQLVQAFAAELHIVHVIEPLSLAYGGDAVPMDLSTVQEQIQEQATSHLREFSATLNVPESRQHLIFGRPESEIQRTADEHGADVIVVGSHGLPWSSIATGFNRQWRVARCQLRRFGSSRAITKTNQNSF